MAPAVAPRRLPRDVLLTAEGELRDAASAAVQAGSLRGVAARIGMSAPGLQHFLDGGTPQRRTLRKLAVWYVLWALPLRARPELTSLIAVAVLVEPLPLDARAVAVRELVAAARRPYDRAGALPKWLDLLLEF